MKTGSQREICTPMFTAALPAIANIWKQPKWPSVYEWMGFLGSSAGKESACNAGDSSSIPVLGRSPRGGIGYPLQYSWAFLVAQTVKNPLAVWENGVQSLGWEDPLEEGVATHSGILAWRLPMDRGAWRAIVHGVTESNMTEQLSTMCDLNLFFLFK